MINEWLLDKMEIASNIYETLKNNKDYELYTNQNLEIKISFKYGIFKEKMMIRPWPTQIRVNADIENLQENFLKMNKKEIINRCKQYVKDTNIRIKLSEIKAKTFIYVDGIWLHRFPQYGFISKYYEVVLIMDLRSY